MENEKLIKLIYDWVRYEHYLLKLEDIGVSLTPEHPLWEFSESYAQLVSEQFGISLSELRELLTPVFVSDFYTQTEIENFAELCSTKLLGTN